MQTLQNVSIDNLVDKAGEVKRTISSQRSFLGALNAFNLYWYQSTMSETLGKLKETEDVSAAIEFLITELGVFQRKIKCINDAKQYHAHIVKNLGTYQKYKADLEKTDGAIQDLVMNVTRFSTQTKFLMTDADNLIRMMATVMCEE